MKLVIVRSLPLTRISGQTMPDRGTESQRMKMNFSRMIFRCFVEAYTYRVNRIIGVYLFIILYTLSSLSYSLWIYEWNDGLTKQLINNK